VNRPRTGADAGDANLRRLVMSIESMIDTSVAERLSDVEVYDPYGHPVRLGDLWREHPVVLVFVRHFG
jgi:hypothetical protein